jgi:2-polyprenyl-3-methyl-5-hydroxy-6-metoxy-1,4-benzoquinol methylase
MRERRESRVAPVENGTAEKMSAAEANRRLYAEIADFYDSTEGCVVESRLRDRLARYIDSALPLLRGREPIAALDACGGSGNASMMLFDQGVEPLTVDVSPEMLALFEAKARGRGHAPRTAVAEIEPFLQGAQPFDLIVFSSALHHLEDPIHTAELAMDRLNPGGVLITAFDPVRLPRLGLLIRRIDYVLYVILSQPRRVPGLIARRLKRAPNEHEHGHEHMHTNPAIGELAERHAATGIDDKALVAALERRGCRVVVHDRYDGARLRATRALNRRLGLAGNFGMVVQAPGA